MSQITTKTQILAHLANHHSIYKRVASWLMFGVATRQGWKSCDDLNQIAFAGPVVAIKMGAAIVCGLTGYGVTRGAFYVLKKKCYPKIASKVVNN